MVNDVKRHFPIFQSHPELIYLDNAATTQRVRSVIERMRRFDESENANVHRGVYSLSNNASTEFENVRKKTAQWIGADAETCIAFTSGTTESINVVAASLLKSGLAEKDNIVTTVMEHHANFIPWQQIAMVTGAEFRVVGIDKRGDLDLDDLEQKIDHNTKIVAVTHVSNMMGTVNPMAEVVNLAHQKQVPVLVDGAQSVATGDLNVADLDCDFLTFSAHKMFGPFGIGILYVKQAFHEWIRPYSLGGGIVHEVSMAETSYKPFPWNLDSGTPNVSGVLGFGAALDFWKQLGSTREYVYGLGNYARQALAEVPGLSLIGSPKKQGPIVSFTMDGIHPHDVASFLDKDNIAVRAGLHCTQPLLKALNTQATVRASFSSYNDRTEVDKLVGALMDLNDFWN